jgi:hypothetical protein
MRSIEPYRAAVLLGLLALTGLALAQQPDDKKGPPRGIARPAPISVDDIVEWLMSFDKNKKGKVTKDDLPERMHHLIDQGDLNKDGALDRDEAKKLAATLATAPRGFGGRRDVRIAAGPGPGFGPPPGAIEGVVDDLKLPGKKKDQAVAAVKAHQEHVRKLMDQARAELLQKMKEILSEEEFKDFQAALDRPRRVGPVFLNVAPSDAPGSGDQRQKDLDKSRREIRR